MASSSHNPGAKYDVFISFRGEDVRHGFLSHLKRELKQKGIDAFVDDRLESGDEISSSLVRAIEESDSSLVIFSENYASSKWCLEELVKIMDCMKRRKQIVTPVFYNIDPSDVRHQKGSYGAAFAKHDEKYKEKVKSWRFALHEAANISGYHYSSSFGDEAELVEKVVKSLFTKLKIVYSSDSRNLVGIDEKIAKIESLMNQESQGAGVIGIWGMGGIGKSTLATKLFYQFCSKYEGSCFLAKVREECERHGIISLRNKMFSALLNRNDLHIGTVVEVPPHVKRMLQRKKVLLVLDDIDDDSQVKELVGTFDNFSPSSRIIITTRNKEVLKNERFDRYEVELLIFDEALELFIMNAFKEKGRDMEWISLSEEVTKYANGLPLALEVLGSFLRGKSKEEWRSQLRKLKTNPFSKINKVLKLSYDGLDDPQRQVFLHIACCLRDHTKGYIIALLDACHFSTLAELNELQDKALITTSEWELVSMHDLIQDMGKEIVCEESRNLGKRSRLWNAQDICKVFQHNMGTKNIESISLDTKELSEDVDLDPRVFSRMHELKFLEIKFLEIKFLKINNSSYHRKYVHLSKGLESLPNELRLLHWDDYPLEYLPSTFSPKNLVMLHLSRSRLKKLWDKNVELGNLKELDLHGSKDLLELPDLSSAKNLEIIRLGGCENLHVIHPSIFSLPKLTYLSLLECKRLTGLRNDTPFKSLEILSLAGCFRLEDISVIPKTITSLCLSNTTFKELPCSLNLPCLTWLDVSDCIELQSLLDLPLSIKTLIARNCRSLEIVQFISTVTDRHKRYLLRFQFHNCMKLDEQSRNAIALYAHHNLRNYAFNYYHEEEEASFAVYPGSKVPEWFKYRSSRGSITIAPQYSKLLGFIFCQILHGDEPFKVFLFLETNNGQMDLLGEMDLPLSFGAEPDSYHVCLYCDCYFCADLIEKIEQREKSYHRPKISFWFGYKENEMKECGVYPIYDQDDNDDEVEEELEGEDENMEGLEAFPPSKRLKQFHVNSTASTSNLGYNNIIEELMDLEIDNNNNINSDDQYYLSLELESRVTQLEMEFASCIN